MDENAQYLIVAIYFLFTRRIAGKREEFDKRRRGLLKILQLRYYLSIFIQLFIRLNLLITNLFPV
jgi:hypothetical protein